MTGRSSRGLALRHCRLGDLLWLTRAGLSSELMGVQYSWLELPLQVLVAPARALLGPFVPACVILVDGEPAGYIGRSPLSGNIEYFLLGFAQGRGLGRQAIVDFLGHHRAGDQRRRLVIRRHNDRSMRTLRKALDDLEWVEGSDYRIIPGRFRTVVEVAPG